MSKKVEAYEVYGIGRLQSSYNVSLDELKKSSGYALLCARLCKSFMNSRTKKKVSIKVRYSDGSREEIEMQTN